MKLKYFIFFIALWLSNTTVFAQEVLTLQEAITIALKNNYDIKLINNEANIAKNNVNLGNAGILPIVAGTFNTGGSRQNTVQTQSTGIQRIVDGARSTNMGYGVGLDWTIFDGFSMFANYDRLKALEEQGKIVAKSQILTTITDVVSAYFNVAKQQQLVTASDSAINVSTYRLRIADNKLQIGRGSKLDVLAAKVDYNTDTSTYLQQKNLLSNYQVTLNQLLARNPLTQFVVPNDMSIDENLEYTDMATKTEMLNPELQSAVISKKIAELNLKVVKGNRYPLVMVNSGYDFNRNANPTGFSIRSRSNGFTYGLTASIPIFNGFLQRQNERNAKIAVNSSELTIERTRQEIIAQLTTAYQTYSTFLGLVKLEKGNVDIADENLDITLEKYRLGSIAPLELREAQRNALNAQSRYLEIQYQAKLAEISLKELSGTLNIQ
ncbi:TolC family protein [Pedobacter cryotolerans]|uniref:TolC family protein n=1 Tax=Pedobacter cryotolerans TaxID=2571270 RepID=A0A4U1C1W9_9SPHI|nr:TolC family protein [Pedobacter cryotolerans]TKB99626.1 TolC family protein [Pedobacter cryotolerans]